MTSPTVARDPCRVLIFDTTLRDGEQAPGCTMSLAEKVAVAEQLVRLGVDVIEAGFPAASRGEQDAVTAVAERIARAGSDGRRVLLIQATDVDMGTARAFDAVAAARKAVATGDPKLLSDILLASAAIPGAFPPRDIQGRLYAELRRAGFGRSGAPSGAESPA